MTVTNVQNIVVPVSDQDRALAFYSGTLGLDVTLDATFGDTRQLHVSPTGNRLDLMLTLAADGRPAGSVPGLELTTDDVDAAVARLREAGVEVDGPIDMPWGARRASFTDPDGNGLALQQDIRGGVEWEHAPSNG